MIVAFEGWNDAGEAASTAARYLVNVMDGQNVGEVDSQSFYDFQFTRPKVFLNEEGQREIEWPSAICYKPNLSTLFDLRVLVGVEPSRNWSEFSVEVADIIEGQDVDSVIFLGSLLADVPHTRPIQVTASTTNKQVELETKAERSTYEGPIGILTILSMELEARGIPTMSLWSAVPHYVHNGPIPKAALALISSVEEYLGIQFDHGELPNDSFKWERAVDELAEGDEDLAEYVSGLEQTRDELDNTNGESIALEVEKFLRASEEDSGA
jgi:predicted ATP-grasp superfamily ATP-dependent carboligase